MPTRSEDRYLPGVPCWVDTEQPDAPAAARFYAELFGWEVEDRVPADVPGHYFITTLDGRVVAGIGTRPPERAALGSGWNTHVWVDSADATAERVHAAGGTVLDPPRDVFAAGRAAYFADPAGAVFAAWEPNDRRGADVVNEPGSWNWSDLVTDDREAALAFYGRVFGWEGTSVDFGEGPSTMLTLSGYGDLLERHHPGIRAMHADFGAPEGFTDAIGWILLDDGASDPPHWSVTFAVADADATAERAERLGGAVIVAPHDTAGGIVRLAVLRDPQGATFAVNVFNPDAVRG